MKGQSLIEAVLALAVIAIVVSAIAVTVTSSLSNAGFAKNQEIATQHAQEAVEIVRKIRNYRYTSFGSLQNGTYCLPENATTLGVPADCSTANVDIFIRTVTIEQSGCSAGITKATIRVSWTDGKCTPVGSHCHKSEIVSCLSTNNPIQSP